MAKDRYEIGEIPPVGEVPERMYAQVIRPERFGEPEDAFQVEEIRVPEPGPHDVLVLVMAAGINYNNVWAARGVPIDVTKVHARFDEPADFHIGGSDASGVVYAMGSLIQLDLAARVCRPETAGTTFALLMSLTNLSTALSQGIGGSIYEAMAERWGYAAAFQMLVALGALFTAGCWLLMPILNQISLSPCKAERAADMRLM